MNYRPFLKGYSNISEIGMGTWQLGNSGDWRQLTEKEALLMVEKALDLGVNFFDTAPNYGLGTSELRLGKALSNIDRSKIVINTKFGHHGDGSLNFGVDRIRPSIEGSLKRLGTEYLDSVILHNPPFDVLDGRQNPHYEVFEKLVSEGKIRSYGASVDTYAEMKLLMDTTEAQVIEVFFNILHQETAKTFEQAKEKGIGLIVKIPLDSGWLTGKYHAQSIFDDIRKRWSKIDIQNRARLVHQVKNILNIDEGLSQKALAFCLAYDAVSTVIPGNSSIQQLENNVQGAETKLASEEIKALEDFYQNEVAPLQLPW